MTNVEIINEKLIEYEKKTGVSAFPPGPEVERHWICRHISDLDSVLILAAYPVSLNLLVQVERLKPRSSSRILSAFRL